MTHQLLIVLAWSARHSRPAWARGRLLAAAATALLAVGCAASGPAPAPDTSENAPSTRRSAPPPQDPHRTGRGTAPAETTTRSPVLPVAADGTNLAGCRDASCEVEVRAGDRFRLDPGWGVEVITVDSVDGSPEKDTGITLGLRGSAGGFDLEGVSINAGSTCVNGDCQDVGQLTLAMGEPGRINEIEVRLEGAAGGRAVLALLPA